MRVQKIGRNLHGGLECRSRWSRLSLLSLTVHYSHNCGLKIYFGIFVRKRAQGKKKKKVKRSRKHRYEKISVAEAHEDNLNFFVSVIFMRKMCKEKKCVCVCVCVCEIVVCGWGKQEVRKPAKIKQEFIQNLIASVSLVKKILFPVSADLW